MLKKALILLIVVVSLTGCIKFKGSGTNELGAYGGVFRSVNLGENWNAAMAILTLDQQNSSIVNYNVTNIFVDPSDKDAVYLGTKAHGLLYSYDNGLGWQSRGNLEGVYIDDIVVNPKDKCSVLISTNNRILQSEDCARTWDEVYYDTRTDIVITELAADTYTPNILYAGTSHGHVLKSENYGKTWSRIYETNSPVTSIIVGKDTRNIMVVTNNAGVVTSSDKGRTWVSHRQAMEAIGPLEEMIAATYSPAKNTVLVVSNHGLMKSNDFGKTWKDVPIITKQSEVKLVSLAIDPMDENVIYYATDNSFYKTIDGGKSWQSKQLPSANRPSVLLVNPMDRNELFMGFSVKTDN
jgi:photosystem II stability/assembly factor-like uncharacterized protein